MKATARGRTHGLFYRPMSRYARVRLPIIVNTFMTKLIIICGLPATGKTTLADSLSERLGIFCLHKDSVKSSLYVSLGMSTIEDSRKLGFPSVKAILDLAQENLIRGVDVILESPLNYPEEGAVFETWESRYGIDVRTIILELNEGERERRFRQRERDKCHHDSERKRRFQDSVSSYEHMKGRRLFLDAAQSPETILHHALRFIAAQDESLATAS